MSYDFFYRGDRRGTGGTGGFEGAAPPAQPPAGVGGVLYVAHLFVQGITKLSINY